MEQITVKEKGKELHYSYESDDLGFKFILYRPQLQSDIPKEIEIPEGKGKQRIGLCASKCASRPCQSDTH